MTTIHFDNYDQLQSALALPPLTPGAFRFAAPWHGSSYTCHQCKSRVYFSLNPRKGIATEYALDKENNMICYNCCGKNDAKFMTENGRHVLYWGGDEVTNWPGTYRAKVYVKKSSRHNLGGWRHDVWFKGPDGFEWHGYTIGSNTEICHVKRTKRQATPSNTQTKG